MNLFYFALNIIGAARLIGLCRSFGVSFWSAHVAALESLAIRSGSSSRALDLLLYWPRPAHLSSFLVSTRPPRRAYLHGCDAVRCPLSEGPSANFAGEL